MIYDLNVRLTNVLIVLLLDVCFLNSFIEMLIVERLFGIFFLTCFILFINL